MTTKERIELAKRINSTPKTLYNWESSKPELIKLLMLGLQKEKELENGIENDEDIKKKVEEIEKRLNDFEFIANIIKNK